MDAAPFTQRIERIRRSSRAERLRARAPRYAFIAATTVLALGGAKELIAPDAPPPPRPASATADSAMESFATEFARAYLTYDAENLQAREERLAAFVPTYLGADAGFSPSRGAQEVLWAQPSQNQEAIAGGRIVTIAVQTDTHTAPVYLAVPVERAATGALTLAGYPSFVGPPAASTEIDEPTYETVGDPALTETATRVVTNYLARSAPNLEADLSRDAAISLPAAPLQLARAGEIVWADAPDDTAVLVPIEAADGEGGTYSLTYELGVSNDAGRWYVQWIEVVPNAR